MMPTEDTIKTFYSKAFQDYIDALDQVTDLYDQTKIPESNEKIMAQTRLNHAREKILYLRHISYSKYGIVLENLPIHLTHGGVS
jgi:hypothetical protein